MVWIETDRDGSGRCRSHPHHTQSEGVCSSCLTEKLAGLTSASAAGATGGSCSSSGTTSPPESSRSSIHVSPALRHRRNASETASVAASLSDGLKKSRSVAHVAAARGGGGEGKGSKKKGWFWSRLLRSTAAKRGGRDGGAVASVADS